MQSEHQWHQIMKKLDLRALTDFITFNEFLRLLEQESYFRDIMFDYQ